MRPIQTMLILVAILSSTQAAYGHAMYVECDVVPPNRVIVNASWGHDEPVAQAAVTVFDANGDTLLSGKTDAAGRYECTIDKPQDLIVEVVFAGHRGEGKVSAAAFDRSGEIPEEGDTLLLESAIHEDVHDHHGYAHPHDHAYADTHDHSVTHDRASAPVAQDQRDCHVHAADDDHRAELVAGIALILSAASFLMVLALRREVKSLAAGSRGDRS